MLGRHNGHGGQLGGDRGHGDPQRLSDGGLPRCSSTPITRTAWPRVVLSGGSVQINSFQQFISFNNTSGLELMALDYRSSQSCCGAMKKLQKRVEALEKKKDSDSGKWRRRRPSSCSSLELER